MKNVPRFLVIHHLGGTVLDPLADTSNHTFEIVNEYHKSLGWGGCGYHYFISKNGMVTQAKKDDEEGVHCNQKENGISVNLQSLGIALAGNFDFSFPTKEQEESLKTLLKVKVKEYGISPMNIRPHRFWAIKTCYGKKISDDWARDLLKETIPKETICIIEKTVDKPIAVKEKWWHTLFNFIKANQ